MTAPYRVAIVVDREFGSQLAEFAQRLHVWICDSPTNRPAVEAVWRSRGDRTYDIESGASIFNCASETPLEDALINILGTVDEHHGEYSHDPPWSVIEVIGCGATARVRKAFADLGAQVADEQADRFDAPAIRRCDIDFETGVGATSTFIIPGNLGRLTDWKIAKFPADDAGYPRHGRMSAGFLCRRA